jgi:GNAT superfamily N-acetyltransferase
MAFVARPLEPKLASALLRLLEQESCSCFCRFWAFSGDKNAWLMRLAVEPEVNRSELAEAIACERELGVLAFETDSSGEPLAADACGWLKLGRETDLVKLSTRPPYRSVPAPAGAADYILGCMLVDPRVRRRGVAGMLLDHALVYLRELGARSLRAYPRRLDGHVDHHDADLFLGPESIFLARDFSRIKDEPGYPVLEYRFR